MNKQIIQIYEMTYQKCTNESTSVLFTDNNDNSSNFFILLLRDDVELNRFKIYCLINVKTDFLNYMNK